MLVTHRKPRFKISTYWNFKRYVIYNEMEYGMFCMMATYYNNLYFSGSHLLDSLNYVVEW